MKETQFVSSYWLGQFPSQSSPCAPLQLHLQPYFHTHIPCLARMDVRAPTQFRLHNASLTTAP